MNHEQVITRGLLLAIGSRIVKAAQAIAVRIEPGAKFVVVWDREFKARAYSADNHNLHFAVRDLDDVYYDYSVVVTIA